MFNKLKWPGIILATIALVALAGFQVTKALQSYQPKVVVEGNYIEAADSDTQTIVEGEKPLGAVVGPDLPNPFCENGFCENVVAGSFIDASTTIVSFVSPFLKATTTGAVGQIAVFTDSSGVTYTSATATISFTHLDITGAATTSYRLACGATSTPSYGGVTTGVLYNGTQIVSTSAALAGDSVSTSTVGIIESGLNTTALGSMVAITSATKISLNSAAPYFTCVVDPVASSAFTNAQNTFDGKYVVRVQKNRI